MSNKSKGTAALTAFIEFARRKHGWFLVAREINLRGGAVSILGEVLDEGLDALFLTKGGIYHLVELSTESHLAEKKRRGRAAGRFAGLRSALLNWSTAVWVVTYVDGWNPKGKKDPGWRFHYLGTHNDGGRWRWRECSP